MTVTSVGTASPSAFFLHALRHKAEVINTLATKVHNNSFFFIIVLMFLFIVLILSSIVLKMKPIPLNKEDFYSYFTQQR